MTGYTRNDTTNNIANGNVINASDLDGEFDAIQTAFDVSTGHAHDGTVGEGAPIEVLGPSQDVVVTATVIRPKTDNTVDLGSSSLEFKDLYIDGTANIDSLVADTADINGGTIDNATIATSNITVGSGKTLDVSAGTLTLADNQISGDKVEGGTINAVTINTLGSTTGNITTVNATTVDSTNLEVTNIKAKDGTASATIADSTGVMTVASSVLTTADINGGTIDGATIGGSSAAAGTFTTATATTGNITTVNATTVDTTNIEVTTLKAKDGTSAGSIADSTGVVTLASSVLTTTDINGGTIDGAVIGGSSAAAGTFTTVTASGDVTIADKIVHSGDTNTAIRFPAADTVTVETSGAERLRVDSSGFVGIGASAPLAQLHVATNASGMGLIAGSGVRQLVESSGPAAIQIASGGTTNPAYIFMGLNGDPDATRIASQVGFTQISATGASDYLRFDTGGLNERLRITSAGNVGIGTSSPGQALSVNGSIDILAATTETRQLQIGQGRTGDGLSLIDFITDATYTDFGMRISRAAGANGTAFFNVRGTGGLDLRTTDAAPILFNTTATERMRIDSSGNVGIGTSSPAQKLTVAVADTSQALQLRGVTGYLRIRPYQDATSGAIIDSTNAAESAYVPLTLTGSTLRLFGNSGSGATIDASGNLGLGVTPSAWSQGKAIEVVNSGYGFWNGTNSIYSIANAYFNSGFKYANTGQQASHYYQFQGQHVWSTAPSGTAGNAITFTQAMTLDASGRQLVGQTSASIGVSGSIHNAIAGSSNTANLYLSSGGSGDPASASNVTPRIDFSASGLSSFGTTYIGTTGAYNARSIVFYTGSDAAGTERARINASGTMLVGTTSNPGGSFGGEIFVVNTAANTSLFRTTAGSGAGTALSCARTSNGIQISFHQSGSAVGSIDTNGTSTSYGTSSDYRLKEDWQPMTGASERVLALKPVNFAWKVNGSRVDGFLAHEAQAVVPEAVTGAKDDVDEDGNPKYQGIDQSKLVPLLTAALQEALKRIEALEAQLNP